MEIKFESIKSLIVEETWNNNMVTLKFKASNQETPMETIGVAMPNQDDIMKKMTGEIAKTMASNAAINAGASALGNLTGIAGAGSLIGSAAANAGLGYQMDTGKLMQTEITEEVRQQTIVNAFRNFVAFYTFENNEWLYRNP